MQTKQELRKFAKELRKTLNINEISEKILQIFLSSEIYENAKNIDNKTFMGTLETHDWQLDKIKFPQKF